MTLRRFWTMVAHESGQLWNASKIAGSLGVSAPTARNYLDHLEATFVVRQLEPFFANVKKRIVKSPKVYIRDSGILHALLGLETLEDVLSSPAAGASWEGLVLEEVARQLGRRSRHFFYRTSGGAEADLVVERPRRAPITMEIKRTLSPRPTRGLRSAIADVDAERAAVVYPGSERYPLDERGLYSPPTAAASIEMASEPLGP